VYSLI